jgi:hypothetical protein
LSETVRGEREVDRAERVSFVFEGKALEDVREIAEREGIDLDEAIEKAIGLRRYVLEVKHDGGRVIVRRKRSADRELVF